MRNFFDLYGRRAIITGGAGMLGVSHARSLLHYGCAVELWDNNEESLHKASQILMQDYSSNLIETKIIDITSETQIQAQLSKIRNAGNRIDILVNNAALNPKYITKARDQNYQLGTYPLEMWNQEIEVGLTGAMLMSKHIGSFMAESKSGSIINIASDLSVISPDQRIYMKEGVPESEQYKKPISYSVIKTGLIGMTRYLATYWADAGVRVNAISPGGVFENQDPDFVRELVSRIPLNRMAKTEDYVGVIQFLASDASSYMTGQNIVVDGGRSVW